ncbi:MAG TPA: YdcF family protein [Candidatus Deferrimicrobium sp.]|nr:YdcF family protein [Candidatus Deferrimicrobium sp.]
MKNKKAKLPFRIKQSLIMLIMLFLLSFLLVEGLIIYTYKTAGPVAEKPEYVLILGSGLKNGNQLSEILISRLELGLKYLKQNSDSKVIVSGGKGRDEALTEAQAMEHYLLDHGIPESRIIQEDRSTSTLENLKNSREILRNLNGKSSNQILLVTSDYHLFRANFLARRQGLAVIGVGSQTPLVYVPKGYLREYLAVIKSALGDW